MNALKDFSAVVAEHTPLAELESLAVSLQEQVRGRQQPQISIDHVDSTIIIAYRDIVILYWRVIDQELVCYPTGRYATYIVTSARQALDITIRLVFEFVRELQNST